MVWADSYHLQEQAIQELSIHKKIRANEYCFRIKANNVENLFHKIKQSDSMSKNKVSISKNMISRTYLVFGGETKKVLFESMDENSRSIIVFVDDVHLGKDKDLSFLKTLIEKDRPNLK